MKKILTALTSIAALGLVAMLVMPTYAAKPDKANGPKPEVLMGNHEQQQGKPDETPKGPDGKVNICHRTEGVNEYILINVSENAKASHLAHGDYQPGDKYPGDGSKIFAEDCSIVDVSAELQSAVYEGICDLFGSRVGDKMTFTFSNDINKSGSVYVYFDGFQEYRELWGKATYDVGGNTLVVTTTQVWSNPRPEIGALVTDFSGLTDTADNPVTVPVGIVVEGTPTYLNVNGSGSFTSTRYLPGEWDYEINLTRACDNRFISGQITLTDPNEDVLEAEIDDFKYDYAYWNSDIPNIAAVGTATYKEDPYNFMFLYAQRALWMGISVNDYQTHWNSNSVYSSGERNFDIHSQNSNDFTLFW